MRTFRMIALMAVVVVVAAVLYLRRSMESQRREHPTTRRQMNARLVGDAYSPRRRVLRGSGSDTGSDTVVPPAPLPTDDPHDRGRALLRRNQISQAIPELREAARNDDPEALTDLAAALISDEDLVGQYPWSPSSRLEFSSRHASALQAIAVLQRAIEKEPDLTEAHFNLALALEKVGLTVEAQSQFDEAIRLSDDAAWNREAQEQAKRLLRSDQEIDRIRIEAYIDVTGRPTARRLLQPYLAAQAQRLRRAALPVYPDSRFFLAADTYTYGLDSAGVRLLQAMQTFCSRAKAEPCAMRYYTAGALYAAGRKSEAAAWLNSIEDEIQRTHGSAGLRALQRWEEGLNLFVQGNSKSALDVFEAQYAVLWVSGERALAAAFDELRRTVRGYLVGEALLNHNTEAAFQYADGSSLRDVQSALAPDAAILRYATTIKEQMIVFVVRRDAVDVVTLAERDARSHQATVLAAKMRTAADPETASLLHDFIIAPVLKNLQGISTIAVIRNFELAEIPFGALFDAGRGQYLAERFTIVHAPSGRTAVELSKRTHELHDSTLLAIGATEFDRTQGEVLAGVDREIAAITAQSLCAWVLSGAQATPEAIQRALAENAVIHYAGHIVRRGADLRLLLASSRGRDSLSAEEIAALRLDKARVVVLSGCGGAASGDPHAVIRTVADAFLLAGVPTVIATSYGLDDAEAPRTMRVLHAFLRNGDDAAEALRKTTLVELQSGRGMPLSVQFQAMGSTNHLVR